MLGTKRKGDSVRPSGEHKRPRHEEEGRIAPTAGAGAGKHEEARVTERSLLSDDGREKGKKNSKDKISAVALAGRPIASAASAAHAAPSASASGSAKGSSAGTSSGSKPPKDSARPTAGKDSAAKARAGAATAIDDDIDALFSSMKAAKSAAVASVVDAEAKAAAKRKKQDAAERKAAAAIEELEAKGRKSNRIKGADSPVPVRLDPETGMPIYTADQLKMGQGGDTADCPFDCDCCFG